MKLYEYTQDYLNLLEMSEELDEDVLIDTLESITESVEEKAENIAKIIRTFEAEGKILKAEEERLAAKRKTMENKISYLKKYLFDQLEMMGIKRIKRPLFTISIQANPPSVDVIDSEAIPIHLWNQPEPVLDKKRILSLLKAGDEIPGVAMRTSKGLRIR
jgi:replicative superfamily II helicase